MPLAGIKASFSRPLRGRDSCGQMNLGENWVFVLPILSLILMTIHWRSKGRDPKVREAITVQYAPPKFNGQALTPSEVGTLVDERLDPKDITSGIVGLAVKGYLRIEETKHEGLIFHKTDYYLKRVKEGRFEPRSF